MKCLHENKQHHPFFSFSSYSESKTSEEEISEKDVDTFSMLPNEWTLFELTREQRLKIYEKAIEV